MGEIYKRLHGPLEARAGYLMQHQRNYNRRGESEAKFEHRYLHGVCYYSPEVWIHREDVFEIVQSYPGRTEHTC